MSYNIIRCDHHTTQARQACLTSLYTVAPYQLVYSAFSGLEEATVLAVNRNEAPYSPDNNILLEQPDHQRRHSDVISLHQPLSLSSSVRKGERDFPSLASPEQLSYYPYHPSSGLKLKVLTDISCKSFSCLPPCHCPSSALPQLLSSLYSTCSFTSTKYRLQTRIMVLHRAKSTRGHGPCLESWD